MPLGTPDGGAPVVAESFNVPIVLKVGLKCHEKQKVPFRFGRSVVVKVVCCREREGVWSFYMLVFTRFYMSK